MARFKNKDLRLDTNEGVLLGDSQEASLSYDGADLVSSLAIYASTSPSKDQHLTNKTFVDGEISDVRDYIDDVVKGLEWQNSVLSITTDIPAGVYGERYIIPSGASGAWSGRDDDIAEYTATWAYTTPSAGFATWVIDEGAYYIYSGSSWDRMGTVVDHSLLDNLDVDDHTQYLLIDGTRAMTGGLEITSVADSIITLTDTTNSVIAKLSTLDSSAYGGTESNHGFNIRTNNQNRINISNSGGITLDGTVIVATGNAFSVGGGYLLVKGIANSGAYLYMYADAAADFADKWLLLADDGDSWKLQSQISESWVTKFEATSTYVTVPQNLFINETSNANMSMGLTINSNVNDHMLAFKSSEVGHGFPDWIEEDTFAYLKIEDGSRGGVQFGAMQEGGGTQPVMQFVARREGNYDTTKSYLGRSAVEYWIGQASGDESAPCVADANIFGIRCRTAEDVTKAVWLLDEDGDTHQDGDIIPFDASSQNIGSVAKPWSDIYCDTLHTSAGSVIIGSATLSEVGGDLSSDSPILAPSGSDPSALVTNQVLIDERIAYGLAHDHDSDYYTQTLLDGGQLDGLYYTQALLSGGQLDDRYYTEDEADTNFAPASHNNTNHSDTYITTTGVTYGALDGNSDIGTGSDQVSQGDHTHAQLHDESHGNEDHTETFIVASGVTYENLDAAGDVGTSAGQVAIGNHTHAQLHNELHTITSHSDVVSATGAQLDELIGGGDTILHDHDGITENTSARHTQAHNMTGTSDHDAGNWKLFYSDGSGDVQELANVAIGKVLASKGTTTAPSWEDQTVPTGVDHTIARYDGTTKVQDTGITISDTDDVVLPATSSLTCPEKIVIPLDEPSSLANGCIWIA